MAFAPATTQQNLPATKKAPTLPVDPAAKAKHSHRPADSGYWAPLANVNKFLKALKDTYGWLVIDAGVQNPTAAQVWEADKENITEKLSNALADLAVFGGNTCPITLTNQDKNQLWSIAAAMLQSPQKFGVAPDLVGAKSLTAWGKISLLTAPAK